MVDTRNIVSCIASSAFDNIGKNFLSSTRTELVGHALNGAKSVVDIANNFLIIECSRDHHLEPGALGIGEDQTGRGYR
jgi:hypothetical protein